MRTHFSLHLRSVVALLAAALLPEALSADCSFEVNPHEPALGPACFQLEQVTIFGKADQANEIAGGASLINEADLKEFETTDVVRAMRRVPGVSTQVEDGYGLRPNISIRGTATERSSRITLLEDNVLIAPAPYAAPSAYYFPTFGRINSVEVLKGPASITQGPYTVGGALNLRSTPIPDVNGGHILGEAGSDSSWRLHGWYGGGGDRSAFLLETHQWAADGFQHIDRNPSDTGLDKQDYLAKLRFSSPPQWTVRHHMEIKLQVSEEDSRQSYLGLTDQDFRRDGLRRYGLSGLDELSNEHSQFSANWRIDLDTGAGISLTVYNNEFERAWYKTEGMDFDGSEDANSFRLTSWSNIVSAINNGDTLGGLTADELQAILDGADTVAGAILLRNNAREYDSRGLQLVADHTVSAGSARHLLQAGLRLHEDQEDRLQRNDSYQQLGGQLVLNDVGMEGNAGNRIQDAKAWAAYVQNRIESGNWTFTPGLRFESIELSRLDYSSSGDDPGNRDPGNIMGTRKNKVDVWIPGMGVLYDLRRNTRLVAGVHKGFSTPGNKPGVNPEESINYEFGIRFQRGAVQLEAMGFFNDYENLVGVCSNSSGSDCEPGDSFNGEGVHIPGLELKLQTEFETGARWNFPLQLTYTWMKAEFQSDFDSDFFGEVIKGDPVPYIPRHQAWASFGMEKGPVSVYLSANYVDSVCTQASCGRYESTESATLFDLAVHYRFNEQWEIYTVAENLSDELYIAGREPYGARPNKPRSFTLGARFDF